MTNLWASEAMLSTSTDVLDWAQELFSGALLTATMLDMNPASPPPVPNRYFALGATGYCLQAGCNPDEAELVGAPGGGFCCWSTQLAYHREKRHDHLRSHQNKQPRTRSVDPTAHHHPPTTRAHLTRSALSTSRSQPTAGRTLSGIAGDVAASRSVRGDTTTTDPRDTADRGGIDRDPLVTHRSSLATTAGR